MFRFSLCVFCLTSSLMHAVMIMRYIRPTIDHPVESTIEGIDHIVTINLKRRPEKMERIHALFNQYGIPVTRYDAIEGLAEWDQGLRDLSLGLKSPHKLSAGELGCFFSHLSVWQWGILQECDVLWVLEDDVNIVKDPHCMSRVIDELNTHDPDWDVLFTDVSFRNNSHKLPPEKRGRYEEPIGRWVKKLSGMLSRRRYPKLLPYYMYDASYDVSDSLKRIYGRLGLHSLIISKRGLKKLMYHFRKVKILLPIDWEINFTPDLRMYAVKEDCVTQWFETTISDASGG